MFESFEHLKYELQHFFFTIFLFLLGFFKLFMALSWLQIVSHDAFLRGPGHGGQWRSNQWRWHCTQVGNRSPGASPPRDFTLNPPKKTPLGMEETECLEKIHMLFFWGLFVSPYILRILILVVWHPGKDGKRGYIWLHPKLIVLKLYCPDISNCFQSPRYFCGGWTTLLPFLWLSTP